MRGVALSLALLLPMAAGAADRVPSPFVAVTLDPALLLPPPPVPDSIEARAELEELHATERARTPADLASARHDSDTEDASIFAEAVGPRFDLARLPETAALFAVVRATEKDAAGRGKAAFRRPRPWIVDPTIVPCDRGDKPLSSYPSGHTTMAFSMATILVRLVPSRAQAIMARAHRYGQSRIVCEQHFRSDVTAGQALGLLVGERLMHEPRFVALYRRAEAELRRARVAS